LWTRRGWYTPDKRVGVQLAWDGEVEVMVVLCLVIVALLPPHGRKSRIPSVKARVVGTKQQFSKSKEGLFYSIYFLFTRFLSVLSLSSLSIFLLLSV
jgi:hypothetical protein